MDDYDDPAWNTPEDMEAAAWTMLLGVVLLIALAAFSLFAWFAWPVFKVALAAILAPLGLHN